MTSKQILPAENICKHKPDWEEVKERFNAWWQRSSLDRPLIHIRGLRKSPLSPLSEVPVPGSFGDRYLNIERLILIKRNQMSAEVFLAEALPALDLMLGPGSLAVYLGSQPIFDAATVWFSHAVEDWQTFGSLKFDPDNPWLRRHLDMFEQAIQLTEGEFLINIPDLCEGVDILSSLRDPQRFCYDLIDESELMLDYVHQLDELYFKYYDMFWNLSRPADKSSGYSAFTIWGPGRTAKVQCDFAAMMSPSQFRDFAQPSLRKQCQTLDHSLFHLDGTDALRHLDALLEIEELDALQWTAGYGKPGAWDECWDEIYRKAKDAGKSLWIIVGGSTIDEVEARARRLTRKFGRDGLYLVILEVFPEAEARRLIKNSEKW